MKCPNCKIDMDSSEYKQIPPDDPNPVSIVNGVPQYKVPVIQTVTKWKCQKCGLTAETKKS